MGENGTSDTSKYEEVMRYWGSLGTAMTSLYVASMGGESWVVMLDTLYDFGPVFYALFLFYIAFFMFVVVNTITSQILEGTMKSAALDDNQTILNEMRKKDEYIYHVSKIFQLVDTDNSGEITWEEFHKHAQTPEMHAFASSLEIDISDAEHFFKLISTNGHCPVNAEMFAIGCMKLKGAATSLDLQGLVQNTLHANRELRNFMKSSRHRLQRIEDSLADMGASVGNKRDMDRLADTNDLFLGRRLASDDKRDVVCGQQSGAELLRRLTS